MGSSIRRWGVFNLVGSGGFAAQVGAIAVLTRMFGWSPLPATAVGLGLATVLNFFGHTAWTFGDYPVSDTRALASRYLRYQIANIVSLGANAAVTIAVVSLGNLPVEIANISAVIVCAVPNYLWVRRSFIGSRLRASGSGPAARSLKSEASYL